MLPQSHFIAFYWHKIQTFFKRVEGLHNLYVISCIRQPVAQESSKLKTGKFTKRAFKTCQSDEKRLCICQLKFEHNYSEKKRARKSARSMYNACKNKGR